MPRIAFRNFTGGEVTPTLNARYDLQKFGTFANVCQNFIPNLHGDIERRPGTHFLADIGAQSVLVPFSFNTESANNFVIAFGVDGTARVFDSSGSQVGSFSHPYWLTALYQLSYAQVGDIIYFAHRNFNLRKLTRSGDGPSYEWTFSRVQFNKTLPAPSKPTVTWIRGPKNDDSEEDFTKNETSTLRYVVTALDSKGTESLASAFGSCRARYPSDWVQGDKVHLTWPLVDGATEYNIYREAAGYYGYIGTSDRMEHLDADVPTSLSVGGHTFLPGPSRVLDLVYAQRDDISESGNGGETYFDYAHCVNSTGKRTTWFSYEAGQLFVWDGEHWRLLSNVTSDYLASSTHYQSPGVVWDGVSGASFPSGTSTGGVTVELVFPDAGSVYGFTDENFEPDTASTPKKDWNPFVDDNPACVCFHQQRMVLAGMKKAPATFYMSRTGDFENFRKSLPLKDDDPVEFMVASGSIDEIKWVCSFDNLLLGTSGAEYKVSASGASVTPKDVSISTQSYWGSASIQPLVIGQSIMHCQRNGSHVRDLFYSWESDGYSGNDLSLLAPQLVESHSLKQWCFQQSPGSNIWAVREDGTLLCLTYNKEQNIFGWSRHVTDGKVVSICSICGDTEDIVLMVVRRTIGGQQRYFLERLADRFKDSTSIEDAFFLDCGVTVTSSEPTVEYSGFGHLEGKTVSVLADGSPESHVVKDGRITLDYPAKKVSVGLAYSSVLVPMPIETDSGDGTTMGKRRAYGKCLVRFYRSVGGHYAATRLGDLYVADAWKERQWFDFPYVPAVYGEACQPYSGDIEISLPGGQDADTSIMLRQDRPLPFRIVSIVCDVDFGEQ